MFRSYFRFRAVRLIPNMWVSTREVTQRNRTEKPVVRRGEKRGALPRFVATRFAALRSRSFSTMEPAAVFVFSDVVKNGYQVLAFSFGCYYFFGVFVLFFPHCQQHDQPIHHFTVLSLPKKVVGRALCPGKGSGSGSDWAATSHPGCFPRLLGSMGCSSLPLGMNFDFFKLGQKWFDDVSLLKKKIGGTTFFEETCFFLVLQKSHRRRELALGYAHCSGKDEGFEC